MDDEKCALPLLVHSIAFLEAMDDERCALPRLVHSIGFLEAMDDERCALPSESICGNNPYTRDLLHRDRSPKVKWGQSDPMLMGFCSKQTSALVSC